MEKEMFKRALEVISIGTFLSMERENSVLQISNTPELWPSALSVLSCVCAWLYVFRLVVTGCCCRGRRLPWQANHSPHPHLPSGLGWSQVSSWAWSYTRWKGKLGREPVSWAWWVLRGWEAERWSRGPCRWLQPFHPGKRLSAGWPQVESPISLVTSLLFKTSRDVSWFFFVKNLNWRHFKILCCYFVAVWK